MAKSLFLSLLAVTFGSLPFTNATLITCMTTRTSLEDLITCFEAFTVPDSFYTYETYTDAQPTPEEIPFWNTAVGNLMTGPSCSTTPVDVPGLEVDFAVGRFTESAVNGGKSWCVLYEKNNEPWYKRGWGLVVVPANPADVLRNLHFSAPHPTSDENTPRQGAALLKRTGGKSLVITGRNRKAYAVETDCSKAAAGDEMNYKTDGAHDKDEPFFLAMKRIMEWQGTCPSASCAYLQLHGKKSTTCSNYNVFLSSGRGNSTSSETCYNNSTLPIRRLEAQLDPPLSVGIPAVGEMCRLTATRNIFARLSQAQDPTLVDVCTEGLVIPCAYMGPFVHIEQDATSRLESNWNTWATAINDAF